MAIDSGVDKDSKLRTGVATDETFHIETHGIDYIPLADRHGRARELFWVWMGSNIIFTYIIIGAALMSYGVSFWQAVLAVVVANVLFYICVAYGSVSGPRTGTSTMVVSRSSFGMFGVIPSAIANWLNVVGFVAVNAVIGTLALYQLAQKISLPAGTPLKAACLGFVLVVTFIVCVWGHATLVLMQTVFSYALGLGAIILAFYVLPHIHTSASLPRPAGTTSTGAFLLAFFLVASGPLSYIAVPADFSRYLSPATHSRSITWWSGIGAIIPAVLLGVIGIAAATETDMTSPVDGIAKIVPDWFLVPFLAVIVGGSITNSFTSLYSSGLGLQTMGVRWPRSRTILVDAAIATAASIYAVFVHDFTATFLEFLALLVLWAAPWGGVYLTDLLLRRNKFDNAALHASGTGPYWYQRGWNVRGVIALAVGIIVAALFSNSALYKGPLVSSIGGGDLSVEAGFVTSAVLYLLLMRGQVRDQSQALSNAHQSLSSTTSAAVPAAGRS